MAFFNRTQVGLRETSQSANVPNDPKAKLMYYLNSVCSVLKLDDDPDINRLRRYENYYMLSYSDVSVLISLCLLLKPDVLLNKCIFQNDALCGDSQNKFYSLETVRHNLLVAGSVMIGGQNKQVTNIMTFKMSWLRNNWANPIQILIERQRQEREERQRRIQSSESCVLL